VGDVATVASDSAPSVLTL